MKITISKSQWEEMGKKAGWIKKAQSATDQASINPILQKALLLWNNQRKEEALKILKQLDPNITEDQIQIAIQEKQASNKGNIKQSSVKSWVASMFAAAVVGGAALVGGMSTKAPNANPSSKPQTQQTQQTQKWNVDDPDDPNDPDNIKMKQMEAKKDNKKPTKNVNQDVEMKNQHEVRRTVTDF